MTKPTSKVQEGLLETLLNMARSPDLTDAEVNWLNQFVMHLIAELSVLRSEEEKSLAEDSEHQRMVTAVTLPT